MSTPPLPIMCMAESASWRVWVDTGGTFTDCVGVAPTGEVRRAKVLSSSGLRGVVAEVVSPTVLKVAERWGAPGDLIRGFGFAILGSAAPPVEVARYDPATGLVELAEPPAGPVAVGAAFEASSEEEAPVLAARLVTGTPAGAPLPPLEMRVATTRGTNALLERQGVPVAIFLNSGFRDLLRIGTQQRPDLFALRIERPALLNEAVVEVSGRLSADGSQLVELDTAALDARVAALLSRGVRSAAIALMHSYLNPSHEERLEEYLLAAGFEHVSRSSLLAPGIRLLPRAQTAVVNAYLAPIVDGYLRGVELGVRGGHGGGRNGGRAGRGAGTLHVMTSAGGLVRPSDFHAKDSMLSGPAGGVVGAARAGRLSGAERIIAFDMGGTSTDVARFDGHFDYVWEHEVGSVRLMAPALAIESVAAGGGSICALDANGLTVGPASAGAVPGPACYGAGGPLTLTDVNLLLGRLGPGEMGIPISRAAADGALESLRSAVERRRGEPIAAAALLEGLLEIADERMADAIRGISLRKGYDPADYALVAFGGAGGLHGCRVAARLGMRTVIVPADAGLLSALGLGHAVVERFATRQVLEELGSGAGSDARLTALFSELGAAAAAAVAREGVPEEEVVIRRRIASLRYAGQDATLEVEWDGPGSALRRSFEARYLEVYGHREAARPVEIESVRVVASSRASPDAPPAAAASYSPDAPAEARVRLRGEWRTVPVHDRSLLRPGAVLEGPCMVREPHSATFVDEGWAGGVDGASAIVLRASAGDGADRSDRFAGPDRAGGPGGRDPARAPATPAAVAEELFINRFLALVGEMGDQLGRTALSTNVKERLDFSCALLDPAGELVANAPHIPVHLGALGLCVRSVRDALELGPGDVAVTNHPAYGGSHLPDVTVITPVHDAADRLLGYVASRAHHAELGGTRPGSMPPHATTLAEEGVVIPPSYLVRAGEGRWDDLRRMLETAPHPTRAVEDNLADLRAQVAANQRGAAILLGLARAHTPEVVHRHMAALQARAERRAREAIGRLPGGTYHASERLDDGTPLQATISIEGDRAIVDLTGSGAVHPGNLNATPAIVSSAVLYVIRLLVDEPLPLNEGMMRAVDLRIPAGLLNPDFPDDAARAPAVVGGNTEVSQRLVDTLLKALHLTACSQGTMNNVLWGTERFGYYETVCGGSGAGPGWAGESGVHCHMTNTRMTDAEVLEHRYPVRVERFEIRTGSGGAGRWPGGDGAVREITFLRPMSLSVLTQHRVERPYGMNGGGAGAAGRQKVVRADGEIVDLAPIDGCEVAAGDRLVLETPGGGGWGRPERG